MNNLAQQDHHHLPQTYLRGWCIEETLLRYRRVGPNAKLVRDRRGTRGVAFEPNLYRLPEGGFANGLSGQDVERELANTIDARLPDIVVRAARLSANIAGDELRKDLIWLMQTFVARSPGTVAAVDQTIANFLSEQRDAVERMLERAVLETSRRDLRMLIDERMPRVAALAGVSAVARREAPPTWFDGEVHVVSAQLVRKELEDTGAGEFVTFEHPVVEWADGPSDLLASLALSADLIVLLFKGGSAVAPSEYGRIAQRHSLAPLRDREILICRTEAKGLLLRIPG